MKWIKQFCIKVFNKVEDHFARAMAGIIIVITVAFCAFFWKWLKTQNSLEVYNWQWLLVLSIFLFLTAYFLYHTLRDKGRLKNQHDIIYAIDSWFTKGNSYREPVEKNVNYYFTGVEKDLNLRRGSSKRYLPMISFKHGYGFNMGKKTFKLTNLTPEKDPRNIFEQHFKTILAGEEKEVAFSCKDIDGKLGWPDGATISWLHTRPQTNEEFEIKYVGRDKIRIIKKK